MDVVESQEHHAQAENEEIYGPLSFSLIGRISRDRLGTLIKASCWHLLIARDEIVGCSGLIVEKGKRARQEK